MTTCVPFWETHFHAYYLLKTRERRHYY